MSEEKVIQHAGKALHTLQDKEKGWGKKINEFFVEILIIVFAVSITLVLHNWNDERHERRLAREFLQGIKLDLDSGAADIRGNVGWFQQSVDYYYDIRNQMVGHRYDPADLDSNSGHLMNSIYFNFDMGRFEAFKSSGYLRLIENQKLLKRMMYLYTVYIPFQSQEDRVMYGDRGHYYEQYIGPKATLMSANPKDNRIIVSKLVEDPAFRYFVISYSGNLQEKQKQKLDLAKEMQELSADIAEELKK